MLGFVGADVVAHTYNVSTLEAEAQKDVDFKANPKETLSQKKSK